MPRTTERNPVDLNELLDAWDKETGDGRDETRAREIAAAYVTANPDDFAELDGKTIDQLVSMVDGCRDAETIWEKAGVADEAEKARAHKLKIDVFLLARVPKRHIGGDGIEAEVVKING